MDSVRSQLRTQATEIDRLEAENADQRVVIKTLRAYVERLHSVQQADAHDLINLAGKLLAVGVELDSNTKAIFRRRGWTAAARSQNGQ